MSPSIHNSLSSLDLVVIPPEQLRELVTEAVKIALINNQTVLPVKVADTQPKLVTRHQAADLLNVSLSTVDNYIREGILIKKRLGVRSVRLERCAVEKLARTT